MQTRLSQLVKHITATVILLLGLFISAQTFALSSEEQTRTEALLTELGKQQNLTFIRNGSEYSAADAESHLRLKLSKTQKRLKTAEQFIDNVASKSSITGEEYQVRDGQGKVTSANNYLHDLLNEKVDPQAP